MPAISSFDFDYCFVTVDCQTGFATVRDVWSVSDGCVEGLEIAELDSLEEALEFVAAE